MFQFNKGGYCAIPGFSNASKDMQGQDILLLLEKGRYKWWKRIDSTWQEARRAEGAGGRGMTEIWDAISLYWLRRRKLTEHCDKGRAQSRNMTERSQRKEDKKKIMGYLRTPFTSSDIVRQTKGQREREKDGERHQTTIVITKNEWQWLIHVHVY